MRSDDLPWQWIDEHCGESVFETAAYLRTWHKYHLGSGRPWNLVFFGPDGEVSFVAPLVLQRERHLWASIRAVKPVGWNLAWSTPCVPFSTGHLERLIEALPAQRLEWDTFECAVVVDDATATASIVEMAKRAGLHIVQQTHQVCPHARLSGSWDTYFHGRSKNLRKNIARLLNKVKREASVRCAYAEGRESQAALDALFTLHQKRWAQRGQQSRYMKERHRRFLIGLCDDMVAEYRLCTYSLMLNDRAIASAACYVGRKKLYYYLVSFDVDFAQLAPGKVLLYFILKDAYERGFEEVNLGPGGDAYKYAWATGQRVVCRIILSRQRATLLHVENTTLAAARRFGRRVLRTFGANRQSLT